MLDLMTILEERGFVHQTTNLDALRTISKTRGLSFYIGFDPTADSLHVGSLIQIMILRWANMTNSRGTALIGDFTAQVGDPTGKDTMRPQLAGDIAAKNANGIRGVLTRLVDDLEHFQNSWWLNRDLQSFMSNTARSISVNRLLSLDAVRSRLEQQANLTLAEVLYPVLQAMDFEHLCTKEDIDVQIGGSDQWGNITMGTDLIGRHGFAAFGITTPLFTNTKGEKMGKTADGAVWLSPEKTSPYEFWQFWRNIEDVKVEQCLKLFTHLHLDVIREIMAGDINHAKIVLANHVTDMVHKDSLGAINIRARAEFQSGSVDDIPLREVAAEYRNLAFTGVVSLLMDCSLGHAKRLIEQNGVTVDGAKTPVGMVSDAVLDNREHGNIIRVGKKNVFRVRFKD